MPDGRVHILCYNEKLKENPMQKENVKKSIIYSGLIGTGGYFFAKLISLFYVIPLNTILGSEQYINFYGTAYTFYSYFLNIFSAGFPFAVATLVAKYTTKNDPKTILLIKRISISFLSLTGFVGMVCMMLISWPLANVISAGSDTQTMQVILCILAVALFFVPVLSAFRGFIQGRKEIEEYAFSQTFEQIFRVGFLLSVSALLVYVFGMERKWALYASVASTVVAAVAGLIQIFVFDKKVTAHIAGQAACQKTRAVNSQKLLREFILLAIPYFVVAILGYSDSLYNSLLLPIGLQLKGYTEAQYNLILAGFNYSGTKIIAIPMILAPGFTAAIIPHITSALEEKNIRLVRKNVIDCLNIILYIGLMLSFCIFIYAKPIFYVMFSSSDLDLSGSILRWMAIEAFTGTLMPVITNIMMALGLRRYVLRRLLYYSVIKGVLMVPLIWLTGYPGAVLSSLIGAIYLIYSNLKEVHRAFGVPFKGMLHKAVVEIAVCFLMWGCASLLTAIGLDGSAGSRWFCFIKLAVNGILTVGLYLALTGVLQVPQSVFHFNINRKKA